MWCTLAPTSLVASPAGVATRVARLRPPTIQPLRYLTDVQFALAVSGVAGLLQPPGEADSALELGVDFELRTVRGKGQGVFARRELPAGAMLARYTGRVWAASDWDAAFAAGLTSGDYIYLFEDTGLVLDAEDAATSGWPRFVNHSVRRANCALTEITWSKVGPFQAPPTVVMLQAKRRIAPGDSECSVGCRRWGY